MDAPNHAHMNSIHWTWRAIKKKRHEVWERASWENMGRIIGGEWGADMIIFCKHHMKFSKIKIIEELK